MTGQGDSQSDELDEKIEQDEATESWLLRDMERILVRLVERAEFAEEIERLALPPEQVVLEVAKDASVLSGARRAYQPIADRRQALEVHRAAEPVTIPGDWSPNRAEGRLLIAALALPIFWILSLIALGWWLSSPAKALVTLLFGVATWLCARFGLPPTVGPWLRWLQDHIRLLAGLPTLRWDRRQELRDEVLVPELREWLNRRSIPSFELLLNLRDAAGLTMPAGYGPLVLTPAVETCRKEVNRAMPGAVGLAGARGVGKTTIAERAVRDEFTHTSRGPMLGVFTSAPVRYDARDFVLHIHARTCRAVIDFLADPDHLAGSESERQWYRFYKIYRFRINASKTISTIVRTAIATMLTALLAYWAWGSTKNLTVWRDKAVLLIQETWESLPSFTHYSTWERIAGALAILVGTITSWKAIRRLLWPAVKLILRGAWKLGRSATLRNRRNPAHRALERLAHQHLQQIRFLQTHTSGWSGKVSAPPAGELTLSRSTAREEQPWTHPEIVERLRDFLELIVDVLGSRPSRLSGVVIAIDELDKISDPEEAHRFLNEIKGVFGVRHCLFLVSVSDDALTAFERRGIPARDAFDSAFTTMIHVDPFTLDHSRTWLAQRALGIPEPYVWLCHCLSGGLPRDLGRVAISLHDHPKKKNHISQVAHALIKKELAFKIRAFTHTAQRLAKLEQDDADATHRLIEKLQLIRTSQQNRLLKTANEIWPNWHRAPVTELEKLHAEAACYLWFCQTLSEAFCEKLDETGFRLSDGQPGITEKNRTAITTLAYARQQMSVDILLAQRYIESFRTNINLTTKLT